MALRGREPRNRLGPLSWRYCAHVSGGAQGAGFPRLKIIPSVGLKTVAQVCTFAIEGTGYPRRGDTEKMSQG